MFVMYDIREVAQTILGDRFGGAQWPVKTECGEVTHLFRFPDRRIVAVNHNLTVFDTEENGFYLRVED